MLESLKRAFGAVAQVFGAGEVPAEDRARALRACGGDEATLLRLIDHERSRDPQLTSAEAHERVIDSFMRDNR